MPLHFNKGDFATRQENKAVGHSIKTGTCKFKCDAAHCFDCLDEFLFYGFLSHDNLQFLICRLPDFSYNYYACVSRVPITLILTYIN